MITNVGEGTRTDVHNTETDAVAPKHDDRPRGLGAKEPDENRIFSHGKGKTKGDVTGGGIKDDARAAASAPTSGASGTYTGTPEEQWAAYESDMADYEEALAAYNASKAEWDAYAKARDELAGKNAEIERSNKHIDEQIGDTTQEKAALEALLGLIAGGDILMSDKVLTMDEIRDLARMSPGELLHADVTQEIIDAAKYFVAHSDRFAEIAGNGNLSNEDMSSRIASDKSLLIDLAGKKQQPLSPPTPPSTPRLKPPKKPKMPKVPNPHPAPTTVPGTGSSGSGSGGTGGIGSIGSGASYGPGLEGGAAAAQDRLDYLQQRIPEVERRINELEAKDPRSKEENDELAALRKEKIRDNLAMQRATETYTAMMTLLTNMLKMYSDLQKQIIGNMR